MLLGLVLNFIKWISEKYIHIHFRVKLWIIKWIYNCIQFYPQAQLAKTSSAHVKRILNFFSKIISWAAKHHWIYMLISNNNNLSIKLYSGECSSLEELCLMYICLLNLHPHFLSIVSNVFFITPHLTSDARLRWGWGVGSSLKSILTECFCFDVWSMTKSMNNLNIYTKAYIPMRTIPLKVFS